MKGKRIIDGGDVLEMNGVGDLQAFHAISVPPFLEVHLEGSPAPVAIVATDLALILDSQSVKFVKPVRNGFSVPSQW